MEEVLKLNAELAKKSLQLIRQAKHDEGRDVWEYLRANLSPEEWDQLAKLTLWQLIQAITIADLVAFTDRTL